MRTTAPPITPIMSGSDGVRGSVEIIGGPVEVDVGVGCGVVLDELLLRVDVIPVVGDDIDGVSGGPAYTQPHT